MKLRSFLVGLLAVVAVVAQSQVSNTGTFIGSLPKFTRSTLPSASSYEDKQVIIIEPDGTRSVWFSDGSNWTAPSVSTVTLAGVTDMSANARTFNATTYANMKTLLSLQNVSNTSDLQKNSATATLTNKTLTSPVINGGTANGLTGLSVLNAGTGSFNAILAYNGTLTADRTLTLDMQDGSRTLSMAGNVTFSGANSFTATTTGTTTVTFPTSGTLATTTQALSETFCVAASDETTALTTGAAKVTFRMPFAMATLSAVRASLSTAQTSGSIVTINVKESGTTIFSTKPTFDNTEKTTQTPATPSVLSDTALADDAEMQVDIDQIGDGTAKGLKVCFIGSR